MEKTCPHCGKRFEAMAPTQLYCSKSCSREERYKRDDSYYDFPIAPDAEPIFSFECANCGKTVLVYSKFDQRTKFCCGICARANKNVREKKRLAKQRYSSNLGMSGGMSLGSLKRREARTVDKDEGVEVRVCPTCGKHFEVTKRRGERKYCSIECEYEAERKKDASNLGVRVCAVCGVEYPAVHVSQKYCSAKCRAHRNYEQQRESGAVQAFKAAHGKNGIKVRLNKTCPECGREFVAEGRKSHQKYCSAACRTEAKEGRRGKEKSGTGTAG